MKLRDVHPVAWIVAGVVLLVGWLALSTWRDRRDERATGADLHTIAIADTALARLKADSARLAHRYTADTVRLTSVETRYRSLRDTLRLTDTVAVFRAFQLSDSVGRACRAVLVTAEQRLSTCDSTAAALRTQRDAWKRIAERPGPRVETSLGGLYDLRDRAPIAQAEVALRLIGRLDAIGQLSHQFSPHESPRLQLGARYTF